MCSRSGARQLHEEMRAEIKRCEEKIAAKKRTSTPLRPVQIGILEGPHAQRKECDRHRFHRGIWQRGSRRRWRSRRERDAQRFGDAGEIERQRAALASAARVESPITAPTCRSPPTSATWSRAPQRSSAASTSCEHGAIQHVAPVEQFPEDKWDAIIAINLSPRSHATSSLPGMRARKWGRIINIASTHGQVASAEKSAYVSAKLGFRLTKPSRSRPPAVA